MYEGCLWEGGGGWGLILICSQLLAVIVITKSIGETYLVVRTSWDEQWLAYQPLRAFSHITLSAHWLGDSEWWQASHDKLQNRMGCAECKCFEASIWELSAELVFSGNAVRHIHAVSQDSKSNRWSQTFGSSYESYCVIYGIPFFFCMTLHWKSDFCYTELPFAASRARQICLDEASTDWAFVLAVKTKQCQTCRGQSQAMLCQARDIASIRHVAHYFSIITLVMWKNVR